MPFLLAFKIEHVQIIQIGILDNLTKQIQDFMEQIHVSRSGLQLREFFVEIKDFFSLFFSLSVSLFLFIFAFLI